MEKVIKLSFNATRENMIDLILKCDSNVSMNFNINVDCKTILEKNIDIECFIENLDEFNDLESIKDDVKEKVDELKKLKSKLNKMMTYEIEEYGEKLKLWKIVEKQKRLIEE